MVGLEYPVAIGVTIMPLKAALALTRRMLKFRTALYSDTSEQLDWKAQDKNCHFFDCFGQKKAVMQCYLGFKNIIYVLGFRAITEICTSVGKMGMARQVKYLSQVHNFLIVGHFMSKVSRF